MKQPSVYLKMRVLGAVDTVEGRTRHERVHNVAAMTFLDEEGNPRQFTWRTIQTWYYRYKNHGITGMTNRTRADKGHTRKVTPEELLEAINAARPHFHGQRTNKRALYRCCIEKGLLHAGRIAQTTFYRFIREYELLAPDDKDHKQRLAFSMKYANQLWQADTMFGPYVDSGGGRKQTKLIAFIDDANHDIKSRVTYSVITKRLNADDMREFILRELDRVGLPHNTFSRPAVDLIVRSADGVLRQARNLCVGCMIEAVRSTNKTIDIDNVNRVLLQPHWQKEADLTDF